MAAKSYIIRNPRNISQGTRICDIRGTHYFEGDRVKRVDLNNDTSDLLALVNLGIIANDDLTEPDKELVAGSNVKGWTLEEIGERREAVRLRQEAEAAQRDAEIKAEEERLARLVALQLQAEAEDALAEAEQLVTKESSDGN